VEFSNPRVLVDDSGACENSDLALGEAKIAAISGTEASYGYVSEYHGHNNVLLKLDEGSGAWVPHGNAGWDESSGDFGFDYRDGACSFAQQ
jgi:hypothetical protein